MKPLADWNNDDSIHDGLIWWARLDSRWQVEVHRAERGGLFCIFDHDNNDELVYSEPVTLMYGAAFGPDMDDVGLWQDMAVNFVDSRQD